MVLKSNLIKKEEMFDKYYWVKQNDRFIVYAAKTIDDGVQMSLYKNEILVDQKTGLLGEFTLKGESLVLKIKNSALKSTHELRDNGLSLKLEKVKLKELRSKLTAANIYNGINPTQAEIEAAKFDFKTLLFPFLLILISFVLFFFMKELSKTYHLVSMIPGAIAGWLLYDITMARATWLRSIRKGRLGFVLGVPVLIGIISEFLF